MGSVRSSGFSLSIATLCSRAAPVQSSRFNGSRTESDLEGELPRFKNSRNVEMRNARLCRSVGSFLNQEADLPFVRLRWRHELADRVEHNLDNTDARSSRCRQLQLGRELACFENSQ